MARPTKGRAARAGLVPEAQQLPAAIVGAGEPPLVVGVLLVSLPGATALDGRVEVGEQLGDMRVVLAFVQAVHPRQVLRGGALVARIAQAVQLAALELPELALRLDGRLLKLGAV